MSWHFVKTKFFSAGVDLALRLEAEVERDVGGDDLGERVKNCEVGLELAVVEVGVEDFGLLVRKEEGGLVGAGLVSILVTGVCVCMGVGRGVLAG